MTPLVKELRNSRMKNDNPFVPDTPLALISSYYPGLCGKLIWSNVCQRHTRGFPEDLLMRFPWLCICVCDMLLYLMVWFGFYYVASGGFGTGTNWPARVIRNHLRRAHPERTVAVKGVAHCERSLGGSHRFPHSRASLLLLINGEQHKASGYRCEAACVVCLFLSAASLWF